MILRTLLLLGIVGGIFAIAYSENPVVVSTDAPPSPAPNYHKDSKDEFHGKSKLPEKEFIDEMNRNPDWEYKYISTKLLFPDDHGKTNVGSWEIFQLPGSAQDCYADGHIDFLGDWHPEKGVNVPGSDLRISVGFSANDPPPHSRFTLTFDGPINAQLMLDSAWGRILYFNKKDFSNLSREELASALSKPITGYYDGKMIGTTSGRGEEVIKKFDDCNARLYNGQKQVDRYLHERYLKYLKNPETDQR